MKKLICGIYAAFAILLGLSLYAAGRSYDGLVEENYYLRATGYLAEREREERAGLSISVPQSLEKGHNRFSAAISTSSGPLRGAKVTLAAMRISGVNGDRKFTLAEGNPGSYAADVFLPAEGEWMFRLEAESGAIRAQKRWIAAAGAGETAHGGKDAVLPPPQSDCGGQALHAGPVTKSAGDLTVTLDIAPKPVTAMRELLFTVEIAGYDGHGLPWIDLSMPGMRMPPNRVGLRKGGDGRFRGKGVIVRCGSGARTWAATVSVPGGTEVAYTFDVVR
ncbi:MAG: FixH family protein [Deltaproteobacteria bacterium]|nr:FixH family protein [Deltaproteobacteria bacterium]